MAGASGASSLTPEFIAFSNEMIGNDRNLAELSSRLNRQAGIHQPILAGGVNRVFKTVEDKNFVGTKFLPGSLGPGKSGRLTA